MKNIKPYLIIIIIFSLIPIVSADFAVNGGFEDGDFTGWETDIPGIVCGTCGGEAVIEEEAAYTGMYGLRLNGSITFPDQNYDGVAQRIPINFEYVTIKYNVTDDTGVNANNNIYCYIVTDEGEWYEVFDVSSPLTMGWNEVNLTKTEIETLNGNSDWGSGTDAWFLVEARTSAVGAGTSDFTVYIDDINPPQDEPVTPTPTLNTEMRIENKINDTQGLIVGGIYLVVGAALVTLVAAIFGSKP